MAHGAFYSIQIVIYGDCIAPTVVRLCGSVDFVTRNGNVSFMLPYHVFFFSFYNTSGVARIDKVLIHCTYISFGVGIEKQMMSKMKECLLLYFRSYVD